MSQPTFSLAIRDDGVGVTNNCGHVVSVAQTRFRAKNAQNFAAFVDVIVGVAYCGGYH